MQLDPIPPLEEDPQRVRDLADEITARGEYQPAPKSWVERFFGWIGDRIVDVLEFLFDRGAPDVVNQDGGASIGEWWVYLFLGVVAAVALWLLWRSYFRHLGGRDKELPEVEVSTAASDDSEVGDWRDRARDYEAQGDYRNALRCRYRAVVADLVDRKVLYPTPGRTAGEHRFDVSEKKPVAAPEFDEVSDLFEETWYGGRNADAADTQRVAALGGTVLDKVDQ